MNSDSRRRIFHRMFSLPAVRKAIMEYVEERYSPRFVDEHFMVRKAGRVRRLENIMQDFVDWWDADVGMEELSDIIRGEWYYRGVLKNILPFSRIYSNMTRLVEEEGLPGLRTSWSRVYYVDLRAYPTWEELRKSFSKNVWKNVRYFRNRLNRKYGDWAIERSSDIDGAFEFAIEAQSRKFRDARLKDPEYIRLRRRMLYAFEEEGMLSLWILRAGGRLLAVNFLLEVEDFAFSYMAGYDTSEDAYRFLIFYLIKNYYESGFSEFNFMKGESRYKTQWTDRFYRLYRFDFEHPNVIKRLLSAIV